MKETIKSLLVLLLFALNSVAVAQEIGQNDLSKPKFRDVHKLRPQISTEQLVAKSEEAIKKGLNFLVKTQNKDGSWGSHDPKIANLLNFGFDINAIKSL